jgi:radical SAM-linked protein
MRFNLEQPAEKQTLTRYRITYGRSGSMRYVGNLDMHTVWERTLRRARLPLAYSNGFNPRPRFHIACSLPMGASSQCELLDAWLVDAPDLKNICASLQKSAPPGLIVISGKSVSLSLPALQIQLLSSEFVVSLRDPLPPEVLIQRVNELAASDSLPREKRNKPYDLRPLVEKIEVIPGHPQKIFMQLAAREGATGRPDEVLDALGIDPLTGEVERMKLTFRDES